MHLTPSPAIGWMPEYLSAEDVEYQAQALVARSYNAVPRYVTYGGVTSDLRQVLRQNGIQLIDGRTGRNIPL